MKTSIQLQYGPVPSSSVKPRSLTDQEKAAIEMSMPTNTVHFQLYRAALISSSCSRNRLKSTCQCHREYNSCHIELYSINRRSPDRKRRRRNRKKKERTGVGSVLSILIPSGSRSIELDKVINVPFSDMISCRSEQGVQLCFSVGIGLP